jgi:hypothetical protein
MRHSKGSSDRDFLQDCIGLRKPERINGAWATGFEVNVFLEGARATPDVLRMFDGRPSPETARNTTTSLVVSSDVPNDGKLRLFEVDFIGRRERCPLGPYQGIVVDRMLSKTLKKEIS